MQTGLQDSGFFSDEAASTNAEIKTNYKQLFFYLTETNEQPHKYLPKLEVASQDLKELVTGALLARALTGYQALMLLAERGFGSEVRATCRSILEVKFRLSFLVEESSTGNLMLAKHEEERVKRLKKMKSGDLPVHKDLANQDWDTPDCRSRSPTKEFGGDSRKVAVDSENG